MYVKTLKTTLFSTNQINLILYWHEKKKHFQTQLTFDRGLIPLPRSTSDDIMKIRQFVTVIFYDDRER